MKTSLTKGLSPEQADEIERDFGASALLRERIVSVLTDKMNAHCKSLRRPEHYADASWPLKQADSIGYERALFEVISILSSKND